MFSFSDKDSEKKYIESQERIGRALASLFFIVQQKESDKIPNNSRFFITNVMCPTSPTPQCMPIAPRNDRRYQIALNNDGPSDVLFGPNWFDPLSILQQVSDPQNPDTISPSPNQMVEIGLLKSGQNVTAQAKNGLWAYNIGATLGAPTGALLIIEDILYGSSKSLTQVPARTGGDLAIMQGYERHDNGTVSKALQ